jgi:hypothetical protein
MDLPEWLDKHAEIYEKEGTSSVVRNASRDFIQFTSRNLLQSMGKHDPRGTPVFTKDWDALIVLDACRVDLMESVSAEYSFVPDNVNSIYSVGSMSETWMKNNFNQKYKNYKKETGIVTANPFSESILNDTEFAYIEEAWRTGWDEETGTVPARAVTDKAISCIRSNPEKRIVIHYMQPHFPSAPTPIDSGIEFDNFGHGWESVWDQLSKGSISREQVWNSYQDNLRYVLDDVSLLLENVDRDNVVISSDHGNAMGEWYQYGHPKNVSISPIREVPWVSTTSRDKRGYVPEESERQKHHDQSVKSRLESLGYIN